MRPYKRGAYFFQPSFPHYILINRFLPSLFIAILNITDSTQPDELCISGGKMATHSEIDRERFLLDSPNDLISLDKWQQTVNLLAELFDAPAGFLVQCTQAGFQATISSQQESNPYPAGCLIKPDVNIFCRKIVESGEELYVSNAKSDPYWDTNPEVHNDGFNSYLGVPVFWPDGEPFGTFCVMDYEITDYSETYFKLIHQLKDILESDLTLIELYNQVQMMAMTDPLTEISNRRGFLSLAEQRIKLARRMEQTLALFFVDVDQFKTVNDNFGHSLGDRVLNNAAQSLKAQLGNSDICGRMGGDEFVAIQVIDKETDIYQAAKKLEKNINTKRDKSLPEYSVTVGVTTVEAKESIESLLEKADQDMLKNKKK